MDEIKNTIWHSAENDTNNATYNAVDYVVWDFVIDNTWSVSKDAADNATWIAMDNVIKQALKDE